MSEPIVRAEPRRPGLARFCLSWPVDLKKGKNLSIQNDVRVNERENRAG